MLGLQKKKKCNSFIIWDDYLAPSWRICRVINIIISKTNKKIVTLIILRIYKINSYLYIHSQHTLQMEQNISLKRWWIFFLVKSNFNFPLGTFNFSGEGNSCERTFDDKQEMRWEERRRRVLRYEGIRGRAEKIRERRGYVVNRQGQRSLMTSLIFSCYFY